MLRLGLSSLMNHDSKRGTSREHEIGPHSKDFCHRAHLKGVFISDSRIPVFGIALMCSAMRLCSAMR